MLKRFFSDIRGNYATIMVVAMVPIMGGLALAVDFSEMSRQRQLTLNALDAAGIATARRVIDGATDEELITYANDFFEANLGAVDPSNATLSVTLPKNNTGGGTLKLSAGLKYQPYFLPAFASMIGGNTETASNLDFTAETEIRLKNTLEVALVLDNSGSMDYIGSGSGKKRMELLKTAAKQLVDTLSGQASQMKQVAEPVKFGIVPFAASVNVGTNNKNASWMDTNGRSPIHHENFDWSTMDQAHASSNGDRYVQYISGVWVKKGSGWGVKENTNVTRFSMYDDLKIIDKTEKVKTGTTTECKWWFLGNCWGGWETVDTYEDVPTFKSYASWKGCVETRPTPYNRTNATPTSLTPATLFVPMFSPDETDNRDSSNRRASGDYWYDKTSSNNNYTRQKYMPKYFEPAPKGTSVATGADGPNQSCTTNAIKPLTDVGTTAGLNSVKAAIDAMASNGGTNVPEGIGWGWRVVSGNAPFTEGRPDTEKGNDKVVIVLTDGENTYYTPTSLGYNDLADNKSIYSAFGYAGRNQPSETKSRLFTDTSVIASTYSNDNYSTALNEHMSATCTNAKNAGIIVMTVALDLSGSDTSQVAQIAGLKSCSSDSRFRRDSANPGSPAKLFWNTTGGELADTFKEIADELSNLRIVG